MNSANPFDAVKLFFAALSHKGAATIGATVTPEFMLLERGEVWDCRKLIEASQGDYQRRNFFALIESEECAERAWLSYWNKALITQSDGKTNTIVWLESAIVQRSGLRWQVRMLHSTRTEEANIPAGTALEEFVEPSPAA